MKVSIFGLGYVGCVSLGCLAQNGFEVVGVDVSKLKVELINSGLPTIIEKDIDRIIKEQHARHMISATLDYREAILSSEISIICVGTPNSVHGDLNLAYIYEVARQIGSVLHDKDNFHTIVIRSTVMPGTNHEVGKIIERASNKLRNKNFTVVSNPEFLREGTAVTDYYYPPLIVIGADSDKGFDLVSDLYSKVNGPIERVEIKVAELIKYVNNSYHALKVVFANEIGNICKSLDIDSHELMRIFCMDHQLNISSYYFKPGFAYGGSCLPKDLKALKTIAHDKQLSVPVLESIELSNVRHIEQVANIIIGLQPQRIGVFGLAFKDGTDDLRFSPMLKVMELLDHAKYQIKAYDEYVRIALLVGSNKDYVQSIWRDIESILVQNEADLIDWADLIVINRKTEDIDALIKSNPGKVFLDLVRISPKPNSENYIGIAW